MKVGIFSKYNETGFGGYHGSPCKIFKIIDELHKVVGFQHYLNNYDEEYDFAIVDRINPKQNIKAKYILAIFETKVKGGWATDFCSISPAARIIGLNHFHLLNYCHGHKLDPKYLTKKRNRKGVFLGRLCGTSEFKIKLLNSSKFSLDLYPIKYWRGKEVLRFHRGGENSEANRAFLQTIFPGSKVRRPISHNGLYQALNKKGYRYGFVPSIYGLGSTRIQIESSSKFFEYIGAGIPVLIESNVPEAKIVENNPFLGEVFCGRGEMLNKAKALEAGEYEYHRILDFAQKNHYPDSRAREIYNNFIKNRR